MTTEDDTDLSIMFEMAKTYNTVVSMGGGNLSLNGAVVSTVDFVFSL